jgi:hypothetical protein
LLQLKWPLRGLRFDIYQTVHQGSIYWKIPPPGGGISDNVIWGKNMKRPREKGRKYRRKRKKGERKRKKGERK